MMITNSQILEAFDSLYPDARCELYYKKDYELLIATVLSAQSTDKRVNIVTKDLFSKYNIQTLVNAKIEEIEKIIKPVGTYKRKAYYIKEISSRLVNDYSGSVPNDREYLESLPGVGRKTCNVVLSNIYSEPAIAVDTHVSRVSKRLKLAKEIDNVDTIERKLMKRFPKEKWSRLHHQMVLFGRYICKAKNPDCINCPLYQYCSTKKRNI